MRGRLSGGTVKVYLDKKTFHSFKRTVRWDKGTEGATVKSLIRTYVATNGPGAKEPHSFWQTLFT